MTNQHISDAIASHEARLSTEPIDWRTLVTREEDPEHLAGTEVGPTLGWGDDCDAFVASLAREHPLGWILDDPRLTQGAAA